MRSCPPRRSHDPQSTPRSVQNRNDNKSLQSCEGATLENGRVGWCAAADVADVTFGAGRLIVQLRCSKMDQQGEGRRVGLPFGLQPADVPRALAADVARGCGLREQSDLPLGVDLVNRCM